MERSSAALAFITALPLMAQQSVAPQPVPLHDGQQVTLKGTLTLEPAGRLQFVTVRTQQLYVPVVKTENGKSEGNAEPTSEVGLAGYRSYRLMYVHRGQAITVSGRMSTDDVTPYFWHATRLDVQSIVLADGTDLLSGKAIPRQPVSTATHAYRAAVTLPSDLALPWRYTVAGKPDTAERFLSCRSNGGGDVVNCSCAEGLHPIHTSASVRDIDARIYSDMQLAQFAVGDDSRRVELSVTCSR